MGVCGALENVFRLCNELRALAYNLRSVGETGGWP